MKPKTSLRAQRKSKTRWKIEFACRWCERGEERKKRRKKNKSIELNELTKNYIYSSTAHGDGAVLDFGPIPTTINVTREREKK